MYAYLEPQSEHGDQSPHRLEQRSLTADTRGEIEVIGRERPPKENQRAPGPHGCPLRRDRDLEEPCEGQRERSCRSA